MEPKAKPIWPALTLLLLAPMTGEILSTSLPPLEFFQFPTMLLQIMLYGCGALLIRELKVRNNLGWLAVFVLGIAYGIYEEGAVVRSFFDPAWMDLGFLGTYGRWIGVNWIWTINLCIFHAVVSIITPLMILDLFYPAYRGTPVLRKGGLIASLISFGLMFLVGFGIGMKATLLQLAACFLLMGLLVLIALRLPRQHPPLEAKKKPARFFWIGLLGCTLFWLAYLFFPLIFAPALVSWFLALGVVGFHMVIFHRLDRLGKNFNPARKSRFVFGTMILFFFFDIAVRYSPDHAGGPLQGLILFSGLYMVMLLILVWKNKPVRTQKIENELTS
ncbi:MAG: hypothetical protein H0S79_24075 [Anaerolineaceae bacterium]|nr:hypothetical protein [Anaerolineaceae bacterium]